ncbi:MAG: cytochrome ubiquinol oxidase subunit I [Pseudomonadota bacterium]
MDPTLDTFTLSRVQLAANMSFHLLFHTITVGLGWALLFFRLRYTATRDGRWMDAYMFWAKVFALSFAMAVISGLAMVFQFGANWPGFMATVGAIAGPLLTYGVTTTLCLVALFLAVMLFGYSRAPRWLHTVATVLVACGTTASTFLIIALHAWMQTPQGFELANGVALATDWHAIIFNPSMPERFAHVMLTSLVTVSFLIAGVSAYRWLIGGHTRGVSAALQTGIFSAALLVPVQIFSSDVGALDAQAEIAGSLSSENSVKQAQNAAPDGPFAEPRTELGSFSAQAKTNSSIMTPALGDPPGSSNVNGGSAQPSVSLEKWPARILVGTGLAMLFVSWGASFLLLRRRADGSGHRLGMGALPNPVFYGCVGMTFSGWLATLAGWYVLEVGRHPWLVQGVLTAKEAVADVPPAMVLSSLIAYIAVYALLLVAYIGTIFFLACRAADGKPVQPRLPRTRYAPARATVPAE